MMGVFSSHSICSTLLMFTIQHGRGGVVISLSVRKPEDTNIIKKHQDILQKLLLA